MFIILYINSTIICVVMFIILYINSTIICAVMFIVLYNHVIIIWVGPLTPRPGTCVCELGGEYAHEGA